MILQKLYEYAVANEIDDAFGLVKLNWVLSIAENGTLIQVAPWTGDKVSAPKLPPSMEGTSGTNTTPLVDTGEYVLGLDADGAEVDGKPRHTVRNTAFRALLLRARQEVGEAALDPVLAFYAANHDYLGTLKSVSLPEGLDVGTKASVKKLAGARFTFQVFLQDNWILLSDLDSLRTWWRTVYLDSACSGQVYGTCLVTGNKGALERLHPSISVCVEEYDKNKHRVAATYKDAKLTSFKQDAFRSFGIGQSTTPDADEEKLSGLNAPVSLEGTRYGPAANGIFSLAPNGNKALRRCLLLPGGTTVGFFSVGDSASKSQISSAKDQTQFPDIGACFRASHDPDEGSTIDDSHQWDSLRALLTGTYRGKPWIELEDKTTSRMCLLALSAPSKGRLAVRGWWCGSIKELASASRKYFEQLRVRDFYQPIDVTPPLRSIWSGVRPESGERQVVDRSTFAGAPDSLKEFVGLADALDTPVGSKGMRDRSDVDPDVVSNLFWCSLDARRSPGLKVLQAVVGRVLADSKHWSADNPTGRHTRRRITALAAVLKLCLLREKERHDSFVHQNYPKMEKLTMETHVKEASLPYRIGRMFAVLEKVQAVALGKLNKTVGDRYFGAAVQTPSRVMSSMFRLARHHFSKAKKGGYGGFAVWLDRRLDEIWAPLASEHGDPATAFPMTLDLGGQGLFIMGYYIERCDISKTKEQREAEEKARANKDETGEEDAADNDQ